MGECGKGEKEWVKIDKSGIFFKCEKGEKEWVKVNRSWKELNEEGSWMKECGKGGEEVGESEKEWYFCLSVRKSGKRGKE